MFNYISSELYRISHKKSNYIFLLFMSLLFVVLHLSMYNDIKTDPNRLIEIAGLSISMFSVIFGIQTYYVVYNDDKSNNVISNVLTCGLSRSGLIVGKFIVSLIYMIIIYIYLFIVYLLTYFIIINNFDLLTLQILNPLFIKAIFSIALVLMYLAINSILFAYYGKGNLALISFIFLATGVINQLIGMAKGLVKIDWLLKFINHLPTDLIGNIFRKLNNFTSTDYLINILIITAYCLFGLLISIIIFKKKDIEL